MSRGNRVTYPGAWYHIFNRGISRKTIYFNEIHYNFFITLLEHISSKYHVEIHSFCLMKNHYHLLMCTPRGNISEAMWYLGTHFSRFVNRTIGGDGPVFKDRFRSILIEDIRYLLQVSRYIHRNPYEAGLTQQNLAYEWSSFNSFSSEKSYYDLFLHKKFLLSHFKNPEEFSEYTFSKNSKEIRQFYGKKHIQNILNEKTLA